MKSGSDEVLKQGYVTEDNSRWMCPECFHDLQDEMEWKLA
jgi:transposase-like protein